MAFKKQVLSILVMLLVISTAVAAQDPTILMVFDASGSMWGKIDKTTKIETARKVMGEVIEKIPSGTSVGLMVYGHRRKGDCRDIELVYPPGVLDTVRFMETVRQINPRGKTPITLAIQSAARALPSGTDPVYIILISDGIETCDGDPCNAAAELRSKMANLIIHVVGFGVTGDAVDQLSCIAQKGGGRFFEASSAADLSRSLATLRDHIIEKTPIAPPPEKPVVKASSATSKRIRIAGPGTVKLVLPEWCQMPKSWYLADPETGTEIARSSLDQIQIRAGEYQLGWRQSEHNSGDYLVSEIVTVQSGITTELPVETGLRLTLPTGLPAPYQWELVDEQGKPVASFSRIIHPVPVPAGTWQLLWRQGEHSHPKIILGPVTIAEGNLTDMVLDTGVVIGRPDWHVSKDRSDNSRMILENAGGEKLTIYQPQDVQLLAPGEYKLFWKHSEHGHAPVFWQSIRLAPHQLVTVDVSSGLTFLTKQQKPPYRIIAKDLKRGEKTVMSQSWGPMPLPPGRYLLKLQTEEHGGGPVVIADDVEIGANELIEIEM